MAKVRVWNKNTHDFTQTFRDVVVKIPAGQHVLMEHDDAILFKGLFYPPRIVDDVPDARHFKMIEIEEIKEGSTPVTTKVNENVCQACRYEGASQADLSEHIKANHAAIAAFDEEAEQALKVKQAAGRR